MEFGIKLCNDLVIIKNNVTSLEPKETCGYCAASWQLMQYRHDAASIQI